MPSNLRYSLVAECENKNPAKGLRLGSLSHGFPYRTFFYIFLALELIVLTVAAVGFKILSMEKVVGHSSLPQTFAPKIVPTKYETWEMNDTFGNSLPDEPLSPWNGLIPPGKGFVQVTEPRKYGLTGGYPHPRHPGTESYSVSMFQQLNCLGDLKIAFLSMQPQEADVHTSSPRFRAITPERTSHCFEYLRQATMCAGDMTLERGQIVDGKRTTAVDGWGATHKCRDWNTMFDWVKHHRDEMRV